LLKNKNSCRGISSEYHTRAPLVKSYKKQLKMSEKKPANFPSPDLSKLTEIVIDHRTKIYVTPGTDIEEAKNRYLYRNSVRGTRG